MSKKITKSEHLNDVLQTNRMAHVKEYMDKCIEKRTQIKEALDKKYADKIASSAINSGSYAKHDAINVKFDIDLCQPFKRNSFNTLAEMLDDVYNFFLIDYKRTDADLIEVRKQNVSIGLTFTIEKENIKMDVVPGRELSMDDYVNTKNLNLYPHKSEQESTKTNIQKHIDLIRGKTDERNIIRLLKVWKYYHNKPLKSFLIELLTLKSFENCEKISSDLWEQLKMTLIFIRDNIETIRLLDPANSNNVVTDTLTDIEKKNISNDIKNMLDEIDKDEKQLSFYYPINLKYSESAQKAIAATIRKENHKPYSY